MYYSPLHWLDRRLRQAAQAFPGVPWGMPPLALSRGAAIPLVFPAGDFLLGEVKMPERNLEYPAALALRLAMLPLGGRQTRACAAFLEAGGVEAVLLACRLAARTRLTVAGGAGILLLCRQC